MRFDYKSANMKHQKAATIYAVLLVICLTNPTQLTVCDSNLPQLGRSSYLMKRSLCNTFGGCGAKRSLGSSPMDGYEKQDGDVNYNNDIMAAGDNLDDHSVSPYNIKKDSEMSKLVTEILDGLIDYLQHDQRFRQGKYTVVVPKRRISSNHRQQSTSGPSPLELQEISHIGGRTFVTTSERDE